MKEKIQELKEVLRDINNIEKMLDTIKIYDIDNVNRFCELFKTLLIERKELYNLQSNTEKNKIQSYLKQLKRELRS